MKTKMKTPKMMRLPLRAEGDTETAGVGATSAEDAKEAEGDERDVDSDSSGDTIPYPDDYA